MMLAELAMEAGLPKWVSLLPTMKTSIQASILRMEVRRQAHHLLGAIFWGMIHFLAMVIMLSITLVKLLGELLLLLQHPVASSRRSRSACSACRGVLNVVHGTHDTVNRILGHKDIRAVSFVGSDAAGRYIYERGSASGKRVQVARDVLTTGHMLTLWPHSTTDCMLVVQAGCTQDSAYFLHLWVQGDLQVLHRWPLPGIK